MKKNERIVAPGEVPGTPAPKVVVGAAMHHLAVARETISKYVALKENLGEAIPGDFLRGLCGRITGRIQALSTIYNKAEGPTQQDVRELLAGDDGGSIEDSVTLGVLSSTIGTVNKIKKEYKGLGVGGKEEDKEGELTVSGLQKLLNGLAFARGGLPSEDMAAYIQECTEKQKKKRREEEPRDPADEAAVPPVPLDRILERIRFLHSDNVPNNCRPDDAATLRALKQDEDTLRAIDAALPTKVTRVTLGPRTWVTGGKGTGRGVKREPEGFPVKLEGATYNTPFRDALKRCGYDIKLATIRKPFEEYYQEHRSPANVSFDPSSHADSPLATLIRTPHFEKYFSYLAAQAGVREIHLRERGESGGWRIEASVAMEKSRNPEFENNYSHIAPLVKKVFADHGLTVECRAFLRKNTAEQRPVISEEALRQKIGFAHIDEVPEYCRPDDAEFLRKLRDDMEALRDVCEVLNRHRVESITFFPRTWVEENKTGGFTASGKFPVEIENAPRQCLIQVTAALRKRYPDSVSLTAISNSDEYYGKNSAYVLAKVNITPSSDAGSLLSALLREPYFTQELAHLTGACGIPEITLSESAGKIPGKAPWNILASVPNGPKRVHEKITGIFESYGLPVAICDVASFNENVPKWVVSDPEHHGTTTPDSPNQQRKRITFYVRDNDCPYDSQFAGIVERNSFIVSALKDNPAFTEAMEATLKQHGVSSVEIFPSDHSTGSIGWQMTMINGRQRDEPAARAAVTELFRKFEIPVYRDSRRPRDLDIIPLDEAQGKRYAWQSAVASCGSKIRHSGK